MNRVIAAISAIIVLAVSAMASASTWNIDPEHSNVGFKVRHLMISNVKGSFEKHSGIVDFNDKDITKSKVEVTIDTSSVNTNVKKRDDHLRSADFFDVAKYPDHDIRIKESGEDRQGHAQSHWKPDAARCNPRGGAGC